MKRALLTFLHELDWSVELNWEVWADQRDLKILSHKNG